MSKISVAILEDEKELAEQFQILLSSSDDLKCHNIFYSGLDAYNNLKENPCDVVLADINVPGLSGIEVVKKLKALYPKMQFLMCTVYEDDEKVFESIKAGATGYILKSSVLDSLIDSIHILIEGGSPMNPGIARRVLNSFRQEIQPTPDFSLLSNREKEILDQLAKGYRYKEIADHFSISIDTIRKHARNIYTKLQVQSRTEAVNKIFPRNFN